MRKPKPLTAKGRKTEATLRLTRSLRRDITALQWSVGQLELLERAHRHRLEVLTDRAKALEAFVVRAQSQFASRAVHHLNPGE